MVRVRRAVEADCEAMSAVRAASIRRLCAADHGNDPKTVADWADRQTPETFRAILRRPEVNLVVAELDGRVVGLAGYSSDKVTLNYVHPDHRFKGVSKALMGVVETNMADKGVTLGRLDSTATALAFYRSIGWIEESGGTPEQGYPMSKALS